MKNYPLFAMLVMSLCLISSCHKGDPEVEVHESDYRNKSKVILTGDPVEGDFPMGIYSLICCDPYYVALAEDPRGYIFVYSQDWELLDVFCHKGRAANEFVLRPETLHKQSFTNGDGHVMIPFMDLRLIKILDITESLRTHKPVFAQIRDFDNNERIETTIGNDHITLMSSFSYVLLDNDINYTYEKVFGHRLPDMPPFYGKNRVRRDSVITELPLLFPILENQPVTNYYTYFNKHPKRNLIVEVSLYMDYLCFTDLDSGRSFLIHGKGTPTFRDTQENDIYETFTGLEMGDSYFIVQYKGGDYFLNNPDKKNVPCEILKFDYEGNFLGSFKMESGRGRIMFDGNRNLLFTTREGEESDIVIKYNIGDGS